MMAGVFGTPSFRHAIERMDAVHYTRRARMSSIGSPGPATLLVETGTVEVEELVATGVGSFPLSRPVHPDPVLFSRAGPRTAFVTGDDVRVLDWHPTGHTRCPDYVRGHVGSVVRVDRPSNVPELAGALGCVGDRTHRSRRASPAVSCGGPVPGGAKSVTWVDLYDRYLESL